MNSGTLARFLTDAGIGVDYRPDTAGGNCFIDRLPAEPDVCIAITELGGSIDRATGNAVQSWQVRTRGVADDPVGPRALAAAIASTLHGLGNNGPTVVAAGTPDEATVVLTTVSTPASIATDALDRCEWIVRVETRAWSL